MSPLDRIRSQIADFNERHPEFDTTIEQLTVAPRKAGKEPGFSLYGHTADGISFEEPLLPGEKIAEAIGQSVN